MTNSQFILPGGLQKFFYNDSGATMPIVKFENPSAISRQVLQSPEPRSARNSAAWLTDRAPRLLSR